MRLQNPVVTVVIDVGGPTKGLHAVALEGGRYRAQRATRDIGELVHWAVHTQHATVIAIDAPCGWSTDGRGRPAELARMKERIWCFSIPRSRVSRVLDGHPPRAVWGSLFQVHPGRNQPHPAWVRPEANSAKALAKHASAGMGDHTHIGQ